MNPLVRSGRHSGITLLEVMILMAGMAVVAILVLPNVMRRRAPAARISCVNNLKQVGLSFRQWGMDNHDKFPMALAMTHGGTMDHTLARQPWVHLGVLSNEINTPRVLACPTDERVKEVMDFGAGFGKGNVSYFVGLDTADDTQPQLILTGDRNLTSNGVAIKSGLHTMGANAMHGWTKAIHKYGGNIGLADGSVQQFTSARFQQHLIDNPQTNRLAIP